MVTKQLSTAAGAAAVCALSLAGTAWACGDKLVALGGGVGFERIIASRNPGHIVLLLEPETGLTAANDRFNLGASLALAGHEVYVVKNFDHLNMRPHGEGPPPDLILIDSTRAHDPKFQAAAGSKGPMIMPVLYPADDPKLMAMARHSACVTVAGGRKGSQLLKAVEHALKLRSRGQSMDCESRGESRQA
jgi:hypothetical protein